MEKKCNKWQQTVCPFSGEKLYDNMTVDQMARSLQASVSLIWLVMYHHYSANVFKFPFLQWCRVSDFWPATRQSFWATVCKTVCPMLSVRCLSCPVLSVTFVHCCQTVGWIKMKLGMQVGLGPGNIVLGGDPAPPPLKGTAAPNFQPISVAAKWLHGSRCHLVWR